MSEIQIKNDLLIEDIRRVIHSLTKLGESALTNDEPILSSLMGVNVSRLERVIISIRRTD